LKDEMVQIDPQLAQEAVMELFANAFQHERNLKSVAAKAYIDNGRFVIQLRELKARFDLSTANWGREPLRNVGQGHYGLGLRRVSLIAQAHSGELRADFDQSASTLVTTFVLPVSK
jgi:K+-sensing histidine kinase KdpD